MSCRLDILDDGLHVPVCPWCLTRHLGPCQPLDDVQLAAIAFPSDGGPSPRSIPPGPGDEAVTSGPSRSDRRSPAKRRRFDPDKARAAAAEWAYEGKDPGGHVRNLGKRHQ